jgi:hypothetical protein
VLPRCVGIGRTRARREAFYIGNDRAEGADTRKSASFPAALRQQIFSRLRFRMLPYRYYLITWGGEGA